MSRQSSFFDRIYTNDLPESGQISESLLAAKEFKTLQTDVLRWMAFAIESVLNDEHQSMEFGTQFRHLSTL